MNTLGFHLIEPFHPINRVASDFIGTCCSSGALLVLGDDPYFAEYILGFAKSGSEQFNLLEGIPGRLFEENLPLFLSGEIHSTYNIKGHLFVLNFELLDFDTKPDISTNDEDTRWRYQLSRQPASAYFFTQVAKQVIEHFYQAAPGETHMFTLCYQQDQPSDQDLATMEQRLRQELHIDESIRIMPCNVNDKPSCKRVLLTLLDVIGELPHRERFRSMIEAL